MTTYNSDFEEHIRDLLSNLYDYLKLINNPVARELAPELSGNERMQAIRRLVLAAIDELQSENTASPTSRQNRLYNILLLRYVEEQATVDVLNQLALSERQYYREHQRAIQTISRIIWDEHFAGAVEGATTLSLAEELDYLSVEKDHKTFFAKDEILAAIKATRVIAERRGIDIRMVEASEPLSLSVSQPVFRQFIVYLLNDLLLAMAAGGRIEIGLDEIEGERAVTFADLTSPSVGQERCAGLLQDATAQALMKSLKGRLECADEPPQISLRFKQEIHKILIVDDNPDTIGLFKRYVANLPYQLLSAQEEVEALRIAQGTPLLCIILDVMLPGKDGWQILQSCKSHPATAEIPVLICSVLEMEDLARSLGADGYLKKPPSRDEFLATLSEWV